MHGVAHGAERGNARRFSYWDRDAKTPTQRNGNLAGRAGRSAVLLIVKRPGGDKTKSAGSERDGSLCSVGARRVPPGGAARGRVAGALSSGPMCGRRVAASARVRVAWSRGAWISIPPHLHPQPHPASVWMRLLILSHKMMIGSVQRVCPMVILLATLSLEDSIVSVESVPPCSKPCSSALARGVVVAGPDRLNLNLASSRAAKLRARDPRRGQATGRKDLTRQG